MKNKVLIQETSFVGEDTYTLSGAFAKSESSAQTGAIEDLARRIVERIIEDW